MKKLRVYQKKPVPLHSQLRNTVGAIAQMVEQRTENPCVPGSIPGGTTTKRSYSSKSNSFLCCYGVMLLCCDYNTTTSITFLLNDNIDNA